MFFSGSNARWTILINKLKIHQEKNYRILVHPQRVDCTRWSGHTGANKVFVRGYIPFKEALHEISENIKFYPKTRISALGYYKKKNV